MSASHTSAASALDDQRRLVAGLAQLLAPAGDARIVETHISFVILTGDRAWKLKKPIDLGFLDFSTPEKRKFYCAEELRLNRRTAPDLYLGLQPVGGSIEAPELLDADAAAIDYLVVMRRFAEEGVFEHMLVAGTLHGEHLAALARAVAVLHAGAATAAPDSSWGAPATVMGPVRDNFTSLRGFGLPTPGLDALEAWSEAEGARLHDYFAARRAGGRVRECHGDLHLGNVVQLADGPVPFDCIEFCPDFRWTDVTADIAFMAMDLERRGRRDLAARFVSTYAEASGDYAGLRGLAFYVVYRALVRAKVAAIQATQPGVPAAVVQRETAACAAYLEYAERRIAARRPALILMHGLSGSGKSRLAGQLVEALGAVCLRSDVVRKHLHGLAPAARSGSGLGTELYTAASSDATYATLREQAAEVLAAGLPVIVDATFLQQARRAPLLALANACGVPAAIVDCQAPEAVLRERIAARAAAGQDASEADARVLDWQLGQIEALQPEEQALTLGVDSVADHPAIVADALSQRLGLKMGRH